MKVIDTRGMACPSPVLMAKETIEKDAPERIEIIVDNKAASENVSRFMQSQAYQASIINEGDVIRVVGAKEKCIVPQEIPRSETDKHQKIMIMVTTDHIGHGDDELGLKLMINFLKTIKEMGTDLWKLVFVNSGVKLTIEGVETLGPLKELETDGVHIMVCGTCLDHYKLLEKKQVGQTTNMLDIVSSMQLASKVINL